MPMRGPTFETHFRRWKTCAPATGGAPMKKGAGQDPANPLICMVRLEGFEPPTYGLEVRCSIHLSYRRL